MTAVRDVLTQIVTIESGLSIASPIALASPRVYKICPPRSRPLSERAVFMNWPDAITELRMGDFREDNFTVQIDFFATDANSDRAADIALAFFDATWLAFDAQRVAGARLGNTVDFLELRAERPALEILEWAGKGYPGFHLFLDVVMFGVSP